MTDILQRIFEDLKPYPEMYSYDPITFYSSIKWTPGEEAAESSIKSCIEFNSLSEDINKNRDMIERLIVNHLDPFDRMINLAFLDTVEPGKRIEKLFNSVRIIDIYGSMNSPMKKETIKLFYKKMKSEMKETDAIGIMKLILLFGKSKNWSLNFSNKVIKLMNKLCSPYLFNEGKCHTYGEDGYPVSEQSEVEILRREIERLQQTHDSCTSGIIGTYISSFFNPQK